MNSYSHFKTHLPEKAFSDTFVPPMGRQHFLFGVTLSLGFIPEDLDKNALRRLNLARAGQHIGLNRPHVEHRAGHGEAGSRGMWSR